MEVNRWVTGTAGYFGSPGTPAPCVHAPHRALSAQVYRLQKILKERLVTHLGRQLEINHSCLKVKLISGSFLLFFFCSLAAQAPSRQPRAVAGAQLLPTLLRRQRHAVPTPRALLTHGLRKPFSPLTAQASCCGARVSPISTLNMWINQLEDPIPVARCYRKPRAHCTSASVFTRSVV